MDYYNWLYKILQNLKSMRVKLQRINMSWRSHLTAETEVSVNEVWGDVGLVWFPCYILNPAMNCIKWVFGDLNETEIVFWQLYQYSFSERLFQDSTYYNCPIHLK